MTFESVLFSPLQMFATLTIEQKKSVRDTSSRDKDMVSSFFSTPYVVIINPDNFETLFFEKNAHKKTTRGI